MGIVIGSSRKSGTPAGRQVACNENTGFPERMVSLILRIASLAHGFRMGALASPIGNVACLPVARNSSFETSGCARSCGTGPGPLAGGMNTRAKAYQPAFALGAKSGGAAAAAVIASEAAAQAATPMAMLPLTA